MLRRIFSCCLAGALSALALVAAPSAAQAGAPSAPPKIMLFGDSLTQGFNGDWTWRYRVWQSLTEAGQAFDFVGPRNDVVEYTTWKLDSQGYRNPAFDRDHASLAGMKFMSGYYQLASLARSYRPDVVVGLIGVNDLLAGTSVADLEAHWRDQIAQARNVDRGVDVVLVPIPETWAAGVVDYNAMLGRLAADLDTATERVTLAPLASLSMWSDTFDYLHPTASGQRKIAASVEGGLAQLGIGSGTAALAADPADDHQWAPVPSVTVAGGAITVAWSAVTYASSENVWVHDLTAGTSGVQRYVKDTSTTFQGVAGHQYSIWLVPVKGYGAMDTSSLPVEVTA